MNTQALINFGGKVIQLKDRSVMFEGPYRVEGDKKLFMVCKTTHSLDEVTSGYGEPIESYLDQFEQAWNNHTGKNIIFSNEDIKAVWEYYLDQERKEYLESRISNNPLEFVDINLR